MIPVHPAPEPERFDRDVRRPGLSAIAEMVGEAPTLARPGPKRAKIAERREDLKPEHFPVFWTKENLLDLWNAYHRICAYSCHYIEPGTGGRSVDHMIPKSLRWDQVYEWKNYRLCCRAMNERKNAARDVVDPFEVIDGWFQIDFIALIVVAGPNLDVATRDAIHATIVRLKLNDHEFRMLRQEYVESYHRREIQLPYLERRAPFLARELRRQGRLRDDDR